MHMSLDLNMQSAFKDAIIYDVSGYVVNDCVIIPYHSCLGTLKDDAKCSLLKHEGFSL